MIIFSHLLWVVMSFDDISACAGFRDFLASDITLNVINKTINLQSNIAAWEPTVDLYFKIGELEAKCNGHDYNRQTSSNRICYFFKIGLNFQTTKNNLFDLQNKFCLIQHCPDSIRLSQANYFRTLLAIVVPCIFARFSNLIIINCHSQKM